MPAYTPIETLPTNSAGERTILHQHLDANHAALALQVTLALKALLDEGGTIVAGTTTVQNDTEVRVQNRAGILLDATAGVTITDQVINLASMATNVKCLVAVELEEGDTITVPFTDVDTGQALEHTLLVTPGRLIVIQGDTSDHPAVPGNVLPVALVTRGSTEVTIDELLVSPPQAAAWLSGGAGGAYDFQLGVLGAPDADHVDAFLIPRDLTIPASGGVETYVGTNPTDGTVTVDIELNGSPVGSFDITTSGVVTPTIGADIECDAGDILTLVFPSAPDSTFAGFLVAFKATLS